MSIHVEKPSPAGFSSVFFLCLVLLFSEGCARKPWTEPVDDNQAQSIRGMLQEMQKRDATCSSTLDTEATMSLKTAMETKSFSGFLQVKLPSFVKFVTANPLGQTLFVLVSDGQSYRSVNTIDKQFVSGGLLSLALRNDVPQELLTGNWGSWLSGRIEIPKDMEVTDIRQDTSSRGVWVKLENPKF